MNNCSTKTRMGGGTGSPERGRNSNIELFRILTMLLIIAHHFVVNSGLTDADGPIYGDPFSWRSLFLLIFGAWGKIGINCFVMVTGYFMCKSCITAKKFAKLLLEIMFYRIVITTVFWVTGYKAFSLVDMAKTLIPVISISNGFSSTFIVFYLLIPFLNILIQHMEEKQHIYLLLWCGFTYIFLGTLPMFSVTMNYVSWFSVLYLIASYIRLYPKRIYEKTVVWGWMTAGLVVLCILSIPIGLRIVHVPYCFVSDSNAFLAVATGFSAFMLFKNLKIGYSRIINTVAASTFGVLLIHANSDTMRQWLWKDVLDNVEHYNSSIMPIYAIGAVIVIYVICTLIDRLRICLIEKPFFCWWDAHWEGIVKTYNQIDKKVFSKLGVRK